MTPPDFTTSMRPSGADCEETSGSSSVRSRAKRTGAFAPPDGVRPSPSETSTHPPLGSHFPSVPHDEHGHDFTWSSFTTDVHECSGSASSTQNWPSPQFAGILMLHSLSAPHGSMSAVETVIGLFLSSGFVRTTLSSCSRSAGRKPVFKTIAASPGANVSSCCRVRPSLRT